MFERIYTSDYTSEQVTISSVNKRLPQNNKNTKRILMPLDQNIRKNPATKNMNQESSQDPLSNNTKRKAGRPRKCLSTKENAENQNSATNMDHESKDDPLSKNSKRKRGRPRKGPFTKENTENRNNATNNMNQESQESPLPKDSQRKPGRPRKSSSTKENAENQNIAAENMDQELKESPLSKDIQRKPGRPRKSSSTKENVENQNNAMKNMGQESIESPLLKDRQSKPGRPRKCPSMKEKADNHNISTNIDQELKGSLLSMNSQRKPGRPRKCPSTGENKNNTTTNMDQESKENPLSKNSQKKPGRPRKCSSVEENQENQNNATNINQGSKEDPLSINSKRKRGRPRKGPSTEGTEHSLNCIPPNRQTGVVQSKMAEQICEFVANRPRRRSKSVELTKGSIDIDLNIDISMPEKSLLITSTSKRVSACTPISPTLNIRLSSLPLTPSHTLNETLFDTVETNRSRSKSADPGTLHKSYSKDVLNKNQSETVESLPSCGNPKTLKVVLEDIQVTKNILRRRSKSLCVRQVNNADVFISETKLKNNGQVTSKEASSKPKTAEDKILIKKQNADKCCDTTQQAIERSVTEHSLNCISPDRHTGKVIPLKITENTDQYVANRARQRSKSVVLTKASDMLQNPLFTSTPKKVSAVTSVSPTSNIRSRTPLKLSHWLNETLFDKAIPNKSRSRSADSSTLHSSNKCINKNQRNHQHFERSLKIVLEDIHAKVHQGQRRRSKSLCLDKDAVESVSSFGKLKTLKVVLKDIQGSKNILRRRSKSVCVKQVNHADAIISESNLKTKRQVTLIKNASSTPKAAESKMLILMQSAEKGESKLEKIEANMKGQTSSNIQETMEKSKQLIIQINALKTHNLPQKEVTFKLPTAPHNKLRKLEPIRYLEESDTESLIDDPVLNLSLKTNDSIPVYRKAFPESPKEDKPTADLYEFIDLSPKKPKVAKHRKHRKSSICFDKNTYEIVKKIELTEAKARKRDVKKALKTHTKNYKTLVNGIVKNVVKNINRKIQVEADIHKEKLQQDNIVHKLPVYENELGHAMFPIIQSPPGLPSRNHSSEPPISTIEPKSSNVTTQKVLPTPLSTITSKKSDNVSKSTTVTNENELEHDMDLIVQSPPGLPSRDHSPEPPIASPLHKHIYINNVIRKPLPTPLSMTSKKSHNVSQSTAIPVTLTDNITTKRGIDQPHEHVVLHSIHSSDNSLSQQDIDSCFGFEEDQASPDSRCINNLKNINEKRGGAGIDSPANFHVRRPNANSTMCQRSPWRPNLNVRQNSHFVSIKNNALPRITQDMVLDHRLVEEFGSSSKIKHNDTPVKNSPVQTSILDFVEGNVGQKDNMLMNRSLYDVEEFDSPDKTNRRRMNKRANEVRRNLQESITAADVSKISPQKRTPLMPLNESQQDPHLSSSATNVVKPVNYFGFEESTGIIEDKENRNEDSPGKPSRFDLTTLKRYRKKQKRAEQKRLKENEIVTVPEVLNATQNDESISVMEGFSEDANDEPRLFEDPEEMLDKMAMEVPEKKSRRRRRDSCDSDTSETGKKKRKHKKTKFELEQEAWINRFNETCDDIDKEQLEVD